MASRAESRRKIHLRIRSKISGSPERPRLNVFRSNKGIYAQVIDDISGKTLAAASSKSLSNFTGNKTQQASAVGKLVAEKAKTAGVSSVVFDRGGYLYHGRVKALADGAREGGLLF
ncbi:MAG: 50S ribosomal protein L18 [Saprospiraceae bacterium]|jgi:large subunit ribosomal protein L18|nr:50S ribosomal protein L18 [Saprospiraceae bacterium]MBP6396395.1 50S ribosomal protein L18 [Saprospiraceae bacterium]MBP9193775.1 50S ribosomal protein L18 [Saprospiraceae bacterium]